MINKQVWELMGLLATVAVATVAADIDVRLEKIEKTLGDLLQCPALAHQCKPVGCPAGYVKTPKNVGGGIRASAEWMSKQETINDCESVCSIRTGCTKFTYNTELKWCRTYIGGYVSGTQLYGWVTCVKGDSTGCTCSPFLSGGYGQCKKRDKNFVSSFTCYVNEPSECKDLVASAIYKDKKISAEACGTAAVTVTDQVWESVLYGDLGTVEATETTETPTIRSDCTCNGHKNHNEKGGSECNSINQHSGQPWCYVKKGVCNDQKGTGQYPWSEHACLVVTTSTPETTTTKKDHCTCSGYKNHNGKGGSECNSIDQDSGKPWCYVKIGVCNDQRGAVQNPWSKHACLGK